MSTDDPKPKPLACTNHGMLYLPLQCDICKVIVANPTLSRDAVSALLVSK